MDEWNGAAAARLIGVAYHRLYEWKRPGRTHCLVPSLPGGRYSAADVLAGCVAARLLDAGADATAVRRALAALKRHRGSLVGARLTVPAGAPRRPAAIAAAGTALARIARRTPGVLYVVNLEHEARAVQRRRKRRARSPR